MRTISFALPQFGFVVATRAMLGAGIALLISDRVPQAHKRTIATTLVAIGALSTIPAAFWVSRGVRKQRLTDRHDPVRQDPQLVGATRYARKGDEPDEPTAV